MSESETGLVPFTMGLHQEHNQPPSPPQQQLSSPPPQQLSSPPPQQHQTSPPPPQQYQHNSAGGENPALNMNMPVTITGSEPPVKKRRGRPRKYGPELGFVPRASPLSVSGGPGEGTSSTQKKTRGRPRGSSNKQKLQALGSTGLGFTPHVLTVRPGEDVSAKIMMLSQTGPRTVFVMSANGTISNATLGQFAASGGTVTYEGRFEILSLSGSFLVTENNGHRSRAGGLGVTLSAPNGTVFGGCVAGLLIAASPVQIVVGSFIQEGQKEQRQLVGQMERVAAPSQVLMTPSSAQLRGAMSGSSIGGHGGPLHQSTGGPYSNTNLSMPWK